MDGEQISNFKISGVIQGHQKVTTKTAKWLCISNIYEKFQRPNFYDIGGTYDNDVADYWFMMKTDFEADTHLLHLFVCNHHNNAHFDISLSSNSNMKHFKNEAYMSQSLQKFYYNAIKEHEQNYVTTFSFNEIDIDLLENKKLYIPIVLESASEHTMGIDREVLDDVKLQHDLEVLLSDPVGSDFTIESADGEKFPVHKAILGAHSEVFTAMFRDCTVESQTNHVKIPDLNKDDLRKILEFIYTGTIKDMQCDVEKLLTFADQYDLKGLMELCQHILSLTINEDNAYEILTIADMYNCDLLKKKASAFLKDNITCILRKRL